MTSQILQLLCSASSLTMVWLMGNKSLAGPLVGLVSQIAWLAYIIHAGAWGLLPGWAGFTVAHVRNFVKWRREEVHQEGTEALRH